MVLATKPKLKIVDKQKLHISRRPGIIAWLLFGLSVFVFVAVSRRLTDNVFVLVVSVLGEAMFGLDTLGEWEDLVLDKNENKAIVTRCNWCDKLCSRTPEKSTTVMKLSDIRHVGVSMDLGLFILRRNGKTASLTTHGLNREEIQEMRKKVNYFLNLSRIECLDKFPSDPYERLLIPSDSDEEIFHSMPSKRQGIAILKETATTNPSRTEVDRLPAHPSVRQQRLSTPGLGRSGQRMNRQRRGPYTDNSYIPQRCVRQRCMAPQRLEVVEAAQ